MPFLFLNIISILALISFYTQSLVSHLSIFYSHCFYQHHQCVPHLHLLICQKEKQMAMETVERILLKCFALFQTKGKQHFSNLCKSPKAQGRPSRFKKTGNKLMEFDDFINNFDDIGLLTAARHI